ncbi:MAG: nuclease domain-containing protein [Motiliproteus sp.]
MLTKANTVRSKALRDSARGEECCLNIASVCNYQPETVVLCHLPSEGKGMGMKSPDYVAVFGCSECHAHLDQNRLDGEDQAFYTMRGMIRTWQRWIDTGLITIKGNKA